MLPSEYRLRRRSDFSRVYARGKSCACRDFVLYSLKRRGDGIRIGFSSSKKLGGAVERNRARRVFRHAAAGLLQQFAPGRDYVFVIRSAGAVKSAEEIRRSMERFFREAPELSAGRRNRPAAGEQ